MPSWPGLKSNFTILDTDDQLRLMKQLIEAENIDEKRWPARTLAAMIDGWKNRGLRPDDVPEGEAQGYAFGKGKRALSPVSGAAEGAERGGFRRPAAGDAAHPARPSPTSWPIIATASATCWWTNIRTPMSSSICG